MANTYSGGCHCGAVQFDVTADVESVIECNCSICSKKATLLTFVKPEQFTLKKGEDALKDYQFNKHVIHHLFCTTCGIESFARGKGPNGPMVAVNVRCLEGLDTSKLQVKHYDGAKT